MRTIYYFVFFVAQLGLLLACSANSQSQNADKPKQPAAPAMSKIETLYKSTQCGPSVGTQWIADQSQFETLYQGIQQQIISPGSPAPKRSIDFSRYGVLFISMGQQRTGGYSVELAREDLEVSDGTAKISVQWREPAPGMMVTQVLTHPCIFLEVPLGNYGVIAVVDQENRIRAELTVK